MRRRDFIGMVSGAVAWPSAVRSQPARIPRIGVLTGQAPDDPEWMARYDALKKGLRELGWEDGGNVSLIYRHAAGSPDQLSVLVDEMISSRVDVILVGSTSHAHLVRRATSTIPIVSMSAADLIANGLIASLRNPGGNLTGFDLQGAELQSKRVGLLRQVLPHVTRLCYVDEVTPSGLSRNYDATVAAASGYSMEVRRIIIHRPEDIAPAFATMLREGDQAAMVIANTITTSRRNEVIAAAAESRIPATYNFRMFPLSGGLLSYGPDLVQLTREVARFVDKILRGASPSDLPVEQPTKFDLVVNLKTAKSLGVEIPPTILATADEVIE